ncbi:hypothetical protein L596_007187 [Steinernema carpocapsae]|nr:hypothetical protein L596_007187 [Steinernema carpocapsae]
MPFATWRLTRAFKWLIFATVLVLFWSYFNLPSVPEEQNVNSVRRFAPQKLPHYECPLSRAPQQRRATYKIAGENFTSDARTLVLTDSISSRHIRVLSQFLNAARVKFNVETFKRRLLFTFLGKGRYDLVVIENYYKYINLVPNYRKVLDDYCRDYNVPVIAFLPNTNSNFTRLNVKGFPLRFRQHQRARNLSFSASSPVPRIAKTGVTLNLPLPDRNEWILFEKDQFHEVVLNADDSYGIERAAIVRDIGKFDGIERIVFGHNITHWMVRIAFLDTVCYAIGNRHKLSSCDFIRYVQIDIDDVFVGQSGVRMLRSDVEDLLETQAALKKFVKNFVFTLGFSGFYFRNGDADEDKGDELLIERAKEFKWFPHMWRHNHVHEHNLTFLEAIMSQNKLFALSMKLPLLEGYAVSPQHTGVYPVYSSLYKAWKIVWNISVTSTEQYPHFFHCSQRRGFTYENISVLPRQTCGLYTHTYFFHSYPDGLAKFKQNIFGGDLFTTILHNQFSIFMTHQQNFANDRLGSYTFQNALSFIKCWTNMNMEWIEPTKTSQRYFAMYPAEKKLIWTNPCVDSKHVKILPPEFNCTKLRFPNVIIVGPQKTGTTALSTFLSLHPNVSTNVKIEGSFEEMQFLSGGNHYKNGPVWYSQQFEPNITPDTTVVFEKTANYFDNSFAPQAAFALMPNATIVVILMDPTMRTYSWYQHLLAHNNSVASSMTLPQLLNSTQKDGAATYKVRQRCITAGRYAYHLLRWLDYYPSEQLLLLDAEQLRLDPAKVLNELVSRLALPPNVDYSDVLRFDSSKRFFCIFEKGKSRRCLGKGKGRTYPALDDKSQRMLNQLYADDNRELYRLLLQLRVSIPVWLQKVALQDS